MKKVFKILLLALFVSAGTVTVNEAKSQGANVSFSVFYNSLKPYGRWTHHPKYGQIWISNTRGFSPYSTGGHWAYTDYGWTWVSNYDWGWAPFHYGRWAYERSYGWYWVPDYEWAPAWVAWRSSGDYYGWAPLSPGLSIGVDLSFGNAIPYERWVFAPHRYITSPYISRYYIPRSRNTVIIKNTRVINNVTVKNNVRYVGGPRKDEVEKINHTKIQTLTVSNSSKPGKTVINKNTVNVYRPVINDNDKTVVNKNSNNTTVNKNSDNTTVNKNSNNTSTSKSTTTKSSDSKTTEKKPEEQKPAVKKNTQQDQEKDKQQQKPPTSSNANRQKVQPSSERASVASSKGTQISQEKRQQVTKKAPTQKQSADDKKNPKDHPNK